MVCGAGGTSCPIRVSEAQRISKRLRLESTRLESTRLESIQAATGAGSWVRHFFGQTLEQA
jgi:hypothetical protein